MAPKQAEEAQFKLPVLIATPTDIGRLLREFDNLNETLLQSELRKDGKQPNFQTSRLLSDLIAMNHFDIHKAKDREQLGKSLAVIKAKAPVLHMSFGADPNLAFIEKLMVWLRREIHPLVLVTFGLQPNLGAGCVLRTPNKQFDLSLRQDFKKKRGLLREALTPPPAPAPEAESVAQVEVPAGAAA